MTPKQKTVYGGLKLAAAMFGRVDGLVTMTNKAKSAVERFLGFQKFVKCYYDITDSGVSIKKGFDEYKIQEDWQKRNSPENE
jgi:hypothetical protein